MEIQIVDRSLSQESADLAIFYAFQGETTLLGAAATVDRAFGGKCAALMHADGFEGKEGEWLVIPTFGAIPARKVAVIGLGKKESCTLDTVRKVGAMVVRRAREQKAKTVATLLPACPRVKSFAVAGAFVEGARLGAYRFHAYRQKEAEELRKKDVTQIIVCDVEKKALKEVASAVARAEAMVAGVVLARDLVNTPSMDMTPMQMAEAAEAVAERSKRITCTQLSAADMERLGMRAALAVGIGSVCPSIGVHLVYKPAKTTKSTKKIVIVGKAVTFDSGGLSIKPSDGMMTMKIDMAGGASVIGLFRALAEIDVDVEVHGIFLAVENMPSGSAYRPGDVVKAMNGTTIEVLNTDAEGRVTLADALSYAVTLKPDTIVDLATLTGAAVVALGEEVAAILGTSAPLVKALEHASAQTGEPIWELPMTESYRELIKSKIADIKNIGGKAGGVITATHFLRHFVGDVPWAHLDIAGPAYTERETRPDLPYGGTGFGVRLLLSYLETLT